MNRYARNALRCFRPGPEWAEFPAAVKTIAFALLVSVARLLLLVLFPVSFPLLAWACKKDEDLRIKDRADAIRKMMERAPWRDA